MSAFAAFMGKWFLVSIALGLAWAAINLMYPRKREYRDEYEIDAATPEQRARDGGSP